MAQFELPSTWTIVAIIAVLLAVALYVILMVVLSRKSEAGKHIHDERLVQHLARSLSISPADAARMLDELRTATPSVIEPRLLLGNGASAKDPDILHRHRITHIVNATHNLQNHHEHDRALRYLRVPVDDALNADLLQHLDAAVDWIETALADPYSQDAVLVHCQQGVSRSASVVLAFLMRARGHSLQSAMDYVHARRFIRPNEAFLEQLAKYEAKLRNPSPSVSPSRRNRSPSRATAFHGM